VHGLFRPAALAALAIVVAACASGSTSLASPPASPPLPNALKSGLIGYASAQGVGVLDPGTGKTLLVAPMTGQLHVSGPVWGPAPRKRYPVLYFAVHDDRPVDTRGAAGVVPYDWLFRADPFSGSLEPLAATNDPTTEGPFGLAATQKALGYTFGCCAEYQVQALDLLGSTGPRALTKPPQQAPLFVEGASPATGYFLVRAFAGGGWFWLNPDTGQLLEFPLTLQADDGPVAITQDGSLAAVSLPNSGPQVEDLKNPQAGVRQLNSRLAHAGALAWSPDARKLAVSVSGQLLLLDPNGADGVAPLGTYLAGQGVAGVSWSVAIPDRNLESLKAAGQPLAMIDALLQTTRLPAGADTPSNRPRTRVYLWAYDFSKPGAASSPVATVSEPTPEFLKQYPPQATAIGWHHWIPAGDWPLLGGCWRYRVVVTGSVPTVASTFALGPDTGC